MSVTFIGGKPGTGKTLFCTYLAKKKYKNENRFKKNKIINIFSNYPIILNNTYKYRNKLKKKEKKIYKKTQKQVKLIDKKSMVSRSVSLHDFEVFRRHVPDSIYIFDEFHSIIDSLDYKIFPRIVSKNFQFHRHFGIKDIYVICQHPSRLVKNVRVLVDEFIQIKRFIKIPFTGLGIVVYTTYFNFEDYGKSTKVKKEDVAYDFERHFRIFRYKRVFNSYDTKYMNKLVETEPYFESDNYKNLSLSLEDIKYNFDIKKNV